MLSYRHAFHAGSFADVLKHAVLVHALRHAVRKPKPVYFLDTHAGAGSYDLDSADGAEDRRIPGRHRAAAGGRRRRARAACAPISSWCAAANPPGELRCYPGSPALARAAAAAAGSARAGRAARHRPCAARGLGRAPGIRCAGRTASPPWSRRMPPPERRGVVLIDPSYEFKTRLPGRGRGAGAQRYRRFATGTFLLWYPVIERARADGAAGRPARRPGSRGSSAWSSGSGPTLRVGA